MKRLLVGEEIQIANTAKYALSRKQSRIEISYDFHQIDKIKFIINTFGR